MNTSSRFIVATHIMTALALAQDHLTTSEFLAFSVNTNAVVIRRILGMLREAGLIISSKGSGGGSKLTTLPEKITLLQIYEAVNEGEVFHLHYKTPSQECPVGANIQDSLTSVIYDTEAAVKNVLRDKKLSEIVNDIMHKSGLLEMLNKGIDVTDLQQNYVYREGGFIKKSEM